MEPCSQRTRRAIRVLAVAAVLAALVFAASPAVAHRRAVDVCALHGGTGPHASLVGDGGDRLPPGHPPIGENGGRLPPGHPPVGDGSGMLPRGHPPIGHPQERAFDGPGVITI